MSPKFTLATPKFVLTTQKSSKTFFRKKKKSQKKNRSKKKSHKKIAPKKIRTNRLLSSFFIQEPDLSEDCLVGENKNGSVAFF